MFGQATGLFYGQLELSRVIFLPRTLERRKNKVTLSFLPRPARDISQGTGRHTSGNRSNSGYSQTSPAHHSTILPFYRSTTAPLHHSTISPSHYCTIAHSPSPSLYFSSTSPVHMTMVPRKKEKEYSFLSFFTQGNLGSLLLTASHLTLKVCKMNKTTHAHTQSRHSISQHIAAHNTQASISCSFPPFPLSSPFSLLRFSPRVCRYLCFFSTTSSRLRQSATEGKKVLQFKIDQ